MSRRTLPGVAVYKRGKAWAYQVERDRATLDGSRKRSYKGGFPTEQEAWTAAVEAKKQLDAGRAPHAKRLRAEAFLQEWLDSVRPSLKPSTFASYRDMVEDYVAPTIGQRWLGDVTVQVLNAFYRHLSESGRKRNDASLRVYEYWSANLDQRGGLGPRPTEIAQRCGVSRDAARSALMRFRRGRVPTDRGSGLAPKTVRNIHRMLHRAFNDAVAWGYLTANPTQHAVLPRPTPQIERTAAPWTTDELAAWLRVALQDRYAGLWVLAATTGMRRSELAGIRRRWLDLQEGTLVVADTRVVVDGRASDSDGKTAASRRTLSLDDFTVKHLQAHLAMIDAEREAFGTGSPEHDFLAVRPDGVHIHPDTLTRRFNRLVDRAGVPRIRLHDVRHTYATLAMDAGVDPKMLSDRMGHANTSITLQIYTHRSVGKDLELARSVSAVIERALES